MGDRARAFANDELSFEVFTRSLQAMAEESLVEHHRWKHSRGS
jgi:hypothetical protein